jgi:hypothetical protein
LVDLTGCIYNPTMNPITDMMYLHTSSFVEINWAKRKLNGEDKSFT